MQMEYSTDVLALYTEDLRAKTLVLHFICIGKFYMEKLGNKVSLTCGLFECGPSFPYLQCSTSLMHESALLIIRH